MSEYETPSLKERYPIDHERMPWQLSEFVQTLIGEPFIVAGGCNCGACVQYRIRNQGEMERARVDRQERLDAARSRGAAGDGGAGER